MSLPVSITIIFSCLFLIFLFVSSVAQSNSQLIGCVLFLLPLGGQTMHGKAFMLLLAIVMNFFVSARSNAGEVQVQTGRINIEHRRNGDTSIDTGNMQLSVPNNRSRFQHYFPYNSPSQSTFKRCRNGQIVRQSNQQISYSNGTSSHRSTSYHQCR
ncbi:hypothetical protein [Crocosphaera chwakensis]|uniref:Uncharacterized protein n=1 Tax=Crocosphaera chwakensis CCY0110 TaxID=391612 RepID=A3IY66_9CHRO|nr:hypothetical protein [Crocosphaera chwakensis]EAZ88587.1 hypothetical protein CY0110_21505 [Crocosphaera chwakensis CCY0110]